MPQRQSDRWVTPGVIVAAILVAGVIVLAVSAGVVYLTAIGRDPGPILQLVTQLVAAVGAMGSLVLQLVGRKTAAKTERNTGVLATEVARVLPRVDVRRTDTQELPEQLR